MDLKKKIGPLPLWSWILLVGGTIGIFLYYRSSQSSASSTSSTNTVDPSNPLGLTYGQETADQAAGIDPLTGQTYASEQASQADDGTDGGGSSGTDSGVDPTTGEDYGEEILSALTNGTGLSDTTAPGQTLAGEIGDITAGIGAITSLENAIKPAAQAIPAKAKLIGKGAIAAPSGTTKPKAPKGYTARGLGNGNWEFVPVSTPATNNTGSGTAGKAGTGKSTPTTVKHVLDTKTGTKKTVLPSKPKVVSGKKKS